MKLFILKLLSLVVLCIGLISGAYAIGLTVVTDYLAQLPEQLGTLKGQLPDQWKMLGGLLELKILWLIGSVAAIVFGIYGLIPRFSKWRKPKKIAYEGPHGQVQIELDTVESSLNNVLSRMPEVKKIDVVVEPRDGGRSALIRANAVLQHQPGQNARAIAGLVSDYIAETATKMLGLEELATIELNIKGINVNSRKSSKQIRKESLSHSGNAPVELLEAAPKPMSLSAPGEPLGSGPIEEEMEEEESQGDALEASAIGTREDESKQAAARSELLEPLNLHGAGEEDQTDQDQAESSLEEEAGDAPEEEETPDIVIPSRDGEGVGVSVVPEPLGDLTEDAEGDEDDDGVAESMPDASEDEEGETVTEDAEEESETESGSADVEVPDEDIPEAVAAEEATSIAEGEEQAETVEEEQPAAEEEPPAAEEYPSNSPWAPLSSNTDETEAADDSEAVAEEAGAEEPEAEAENGDAADSETSSEDGGLAFAWEKQFDDGDGAATETVEDAASDGDDADGEANPNLMDSESTDSIIGDLDDEPAPETEDEAPAPSGSEEGEGGAKKGWGWFN